MGSASRETSRGTEAVRKSLRLALFVLPAFAASLSAGVGGRVSGTVTDSSGAAVPGATVTAINGDTNVRQTTTDSKGVYSLSNLSVGSYAVRVEARGFKPYQRTGVVVDADSAQLIDVPLVVGERKGVRLRHSCGSGRYAAR
jgi:hypothetical protein